MANTQKPSANKSKKPSAGARPKMTAPTKENNGPRLATRPTLVPQPSRTLASSNGTKDSEMDGAKDAETAALVASLRG
jgi:hypothetical protein